MNTHVFEEENTRQSSDKLQDVFSKLTDIWQYRFRPQLVKSSDIIETVAPEENPVIVSGAYVATDDDTDSVVTEALARRLEKELRAAKSAQLACGEVLLPCDLLTRISRNVLTMAENEPCGLRGCTLYLNFESPDEVRHIGTIQCDPNTVSTFVLYLTLKQDSSSWHSLLPQFLKNLTRGGSIVISPAFVLEKKKLYRSYQEDN